MKRKYFDDEWFARISLLLKRNKRSTAISELSVYLENYPYDVNARTIYASILVSLGRIDEVENIINNTVLTRRTSDRNIYELIKIKVKLLCYQNKYEEAYELFMDNASLFKEYLDDYYGTLIFFEKKLGLETDASLFCHTYNCEQILSYSEDRALEHISKHVGDSELQTGSYFLSSFPLSKLYYELRDILPIKCDYNMHSNICTDVYLFNYDDCGREFSKSVDYIKVICIHDTNDILTMFPYRNSDNLPCIDYNFKCLTVSEDIPRVKKISQIDKFNQRYGKIVDKK